MKILLISFALFLSFTAHAQNGTKKTSADGSPVIKIKSGAIRGVSNDGVTSFKGIPYAAPPLGKFRWRPPQPVKRWAGVLNANKFGADGAQAARDGNGAIAKGSSEDCLYLNLWLPTCTRSSAKLPVMVWIHGGAFVGGSGSGAATSGEEFAKQGVILMTFNYRLGRLGHFAFPALSKEHPEEFKGSYAYMDHIAALKWVQQNIGAFGGDSGNITIFGESAGGVSVHSLLTIPAAKGLFHKAIIESGGGRDGVLTGRPINKENADRFYPVSAETIGINFARKHGIEGTDAAALARLRSLSVEEIVDGGQETTGSGGAAIYSGPILDGKLVVETAESAYKNGRAPNIPLIIGSNSAEVGGGFINARTKEELLATFGNYKEEAAKAYAADTSNFARLMTMITTDKVWAEPARFTATEFSKKNIPAYVYLFSYVPQSAIQRSPFGAVHASEIAYVFNNLKARRGIDTITTEDKRVANLMNRYWVNFAKTGNPNGNNLPEWPGYNSHKNQILEFLANGSAVGLTDPKKARLDVIEKSLNE